MQRGDVYIMPFPFTDLKHAKVRPVLVLAALPGNDCIVCMITTRLAHSKHAVPVGPEDVLNGAIRPGSIRVERLVTCEKTVLFEKIATLKPGALETTLAAARSLFA